MGQLGNFHKISCWTTLPSTKWTFPTTTGPLIKLNETFCLSRNKSEKLILENFWWIRVTNWASTFNVSHNRLRQLLIDRHLSYEKLETLDVSHNQLTSIDPLLTHNLPVLSTLILSNNLLEFRIRQQFSPNANLANVFLDSNPISWLNLDIFENFTNLTYIDVSNCQKLRHLTGGSKTLTKLSIGNGSIRKLPQDFLMNNPAIKEMDISHINWTCNCNLAWLSLKDRPLLIKSNETFCLGKNNSDKVDLLEFLTSWVDVMKTCQSPASTSSLNGIFELKFQRVYTL